MAVLERESCISVVGVATSCDEAITAVERERPSTVVIGHDPPKVDGIELTRKFKRPGISDVSSVLLLEISSIDSDLIPALQVGARGVLRKDQAPQMLVPTVRNIVSGAVVIAPPAAAQLAKQLTQMPGPRYAETATAMDCLTSRELEVLRLVARGLHNRDIAETLSVSEPTVKSHLYSLCRKLDLRNRTQVAILAYETGLIRPTANRYDTSEAAAG